MENIYIYIVRGFDQPYRFFGALRQQKKRQLTNKDWTFSTGINQQKSDLTTKHTGLANKNGNVITGNWNLYNMI